MAGLGLVVHPFDQTHIPAALAAYRRFGKGFHPKARLNLGDCASYALAASLAAALLYKGEDFAATDVVSALPLAGTSQA